MSSLYILEIKPLCKMISFANIFSHTVGSLFIFLVFSLAVQTLFILMRSHLFILSFMFLALGDISVKVLLHAVKLPFDPEIQLLGLRIPRNTNSEEPMHPNVRNSTMYNSQLLEAT